MDLVNVTRYRVADSRAALALEPGERMLAGGTWLFSEPQPEVSGLVDLTGLGWAPWELLPDGGLRIGATCTVEEVQQAPWPDPAFVRSCADALLMSWKVQRAATVGGNLCLALPAAAMVSLTAAYSAEAVIWTASGDERRERVDTFVRGDGLTSLAPGEVLRAVDVPPAALAAPVVVRRIALTDLGRSAALVTGRRDRDGLHLVVTAATPRPVVIELPLDGGDDDVRRAVAGIRAWHDDVHGAPDWRRAMTERLALEVVAELVSGGGA